MQMCPYCGNVYDESNESKCSFCSNKIAIPGKDDKCKPMPRDVFEKLRKSFSKE